MKKSVLRSYKNGSQEKGYSVSSNVYQRMNGNAQFINEQPLIDILKTTKTALEFAKGEASSGDSIKISIKNECYKALIKQLDKVADAIDEKAEGNVKIAQDAGFETISTSRRSIDFLATPTGLWADDVKGRKGFIKVGWNKDGDSINTVVEFQVQGEENAPWQMGTHSSASSTLLSGLPSGKYVAIRIYSTGRKGLTSDISDTVVVLVS